MTIPQQYLAAARKASEAVSAFIDAGPDGSEDWSLRRGDIAMDAAHALYSLLLVIGDAPVIGAGTAHGGSSSSARCGSAAASRGSREPLPA
jgi:hypothetical protein